ncbi:MAG TPA: glycosyltransferase family 2 protein, partial [Tepidisphaeraceae bacterium]|nr:glycosyltransferase family 2 protein [Tepidisphaeraceae bacterium]
ALESTGRTWEILFVNDGSRDRSPQIIREFHTADPRIKLLTLSRNFGHQPALTAGVHHATGRCVILIDGDLQDPPELVPALVKQWLAGHQVVLAERTTRPEHGPRRLGFRLFYPLMRWISDLPQAPDAGIFCLMDRVVVDHFNRLPERNRFIPGLRTWLGFQQTTVPYARQPRRAGSPKQTIPRLTRYAFDALFSFSYKPLRVATWMGFLVSAVAFLLGLFYFIDFFWKNKQAGSGFTTIILCLLFLGGVQLLCIGILGEYLARIYDEVKQRPLYLIADHLGLDDPPPPQP